MAKKKLSPSSSSSKRPRSKYAVFISHSSHDRWIARVIAEKIQAIGVETWIDEKDLEGGDVLAERVLQGIEACTEAVILVSEHSVRSHWVTFEAGAARVLRMRVTPILNGVTLETIEPLRDIKAVELNSFDDFLEQLKKRVTSR